MTVALNGLLSTVFGDPIVNALAPFWVELSLFACFLLGYLLLRQGGQLHLAVQGKRDGKLIKKRPTPTTASAAWVPLPKLQAAVKAGSAPDRVLELWREGSQLTATPLPLWRAVVQALAGAQGDGAADEALDHIRRHQVAMAKPAFASSLLDAFARAGQAGVLWRMHAELSAPPLQVPSSAQTHEALIGGFAAAGDDARLQDALNEAGRGGAAPTARALCLLVKGHLKNSRVDAVSEAFALFPKYGHAVPQFALVQFVRTACAAGRTEDALTAVASDMCPDVASALLEDACRRADVPLAKRVRKLTRRRGIQLSGAAHGCLLRTLAAAGDPDAPRYFREMTALAPSGHISNNQCVGVLARCAESKFLAFAEEVVSFCRGRGGLTITLFSALMKVYAYCGMYEKACDLYHEVLREGLEPDNLMYGCLMRFAGECGRGDLVKELAEKAPNLEIKNYMSLIRSAAREGDVQRAFDILDQLRVQGMAPDTLLYNCVLDACSRAGLVTKAREFVSGMKSAGLADAVSFNTLIKAHCSKGDLAGALAVLDEMRSAGRPPNDVSYNCIINAAASGGRMQVAWRTIERMQADGVRVDHYTMATLLKWARKGGGHVDARRVFDLLDTCGVEVTSDEVLLTTVLEACIKFGDRRRLEAILSAYGKSSLQCGLFAYGSMLKAAGFLKWPERCWGLWEELTVARGLEPNDVVFGCMVDALVTSRRTDEAVELLGIWEKRVPANTVVYSTIIKGLASEMQAERAMALWRRIRRDGIPANAIMYNAVVDAQARVGLVSNVPELLAAMGEDGVTPDAITYSTIVKGYCIKGDLDQACKVFADMRSNGLVKDCIVYNTLLDGCCRHQKYRLADDILAQLEESGVAFTNYTLSILVKLYGRRRQVDRALRVVDEVPAGHGFVANPQVLSALSCACISNEMPRRGLEILNGVIQSSGLDGRSLGANVSALVRGGYLDQAVALIDSACGLAPGPNKPAAPLWHVPGEAALDKVAQALAQDGRAEEVWTPLLDRLKRAGVTFDAAACEAALRHPSAGRWPKPAMPGQMRRGKRVPA